MSSKDLKNIFFEEVDELLAKIESCLLQLEQDPFQDELIDEIFRSVHTIKGSGAFFEINNLGEFSHKLEDALDALRSQDKNIIDGEAIELMFKSLDVLRLIIDSDKEGNKDLQMQLEGITGELMQEIENLVGKTNSAGHDGTAEEGLLADFKDHLGIISQSIEEGKNLFSIKVELAGSSLSEGLDPLSFLRNLNKNGSIIDNLSSYRDIPELSELDLKKLYLNKMHILYATKDPVDTINDILEFAGHKGNITVEEIGENDLAAFLRNNADTGSNRVKQLGELLVEDGLVQKSDLEEALAKQQRPIGEILVEDKKITRDQLQEALNRQESQGVKRTSIKVNSSKLDALVDLVGELVISHSLVMQSPILKQNSDAYLAANASQLGKVIGEMQDQIMALRMIPISDNFNRANRIIRDVCAQLKKQVKLTVFGEDTEIDKNIADDLNEVLVHILRNAVDHGIETPKERQRAGKPESGRVQLVAYPQGGNIIIEIKDDGRGLDKEKIIAQAKDRGIDVDPDNDAQLFRLIFDPGFSTAKEVTNLSGRGVGLDVAKKRLEAIRGKIEVFSELGKGTTFKVTLQPTLAIIDGMVFRVGDERLIIPTLAIEESLRPAQDQIIEVENNSEAVMIRGKVYPLIRLHELFSIETNSTNPWESLVMVAKSHGRTCVILIDELIGQQQVVIKSLGERFKNLKTVSGGAILGDGRVGLILDLDGLLDSGTQLN